jgi:hypothetical protein
MHDFENLTCPACGAPSGRPLATFVKQPRWKCACGFSVVVPTTQVQAMLVRIEQAKKLVRFAGPQE